MVQIAGGACGSRDAGHFRSHRNPDLRVTDMWRKRSYGSGSRTLRRTPRNDATVESVETRAMNAELSIAPVTRFESSGSHDAHIIE